MEILGWTLLGIVVIWVLIAIFGGSNKKNRSGFDISDMISTLIF